jgi:putative DNA primase/helicase
MLHGKRLAVAQETDEGKALCGAMLKRLVSTDVMVAKHLYRDPFNFIPTHTLVLSTNHLPRIKSNDTGTWRRIDVLPFNATIAPEKTIKDYMGMLVKECGSEILQWCIDGARAFYENGCIIKKKPEAVETARAEYRENEDWLMQFITECVDESQEAQGKILAHSDLYAVYAAWCARTGMYKRSSIMLSKALRLQGWSGGNKVWVNELQKVAMIWNDKALVQGVLNRSNVIKIRETA